MLEGGSGSEFGADLVDFCLRLICFEMRVQNNE